MGMPHRSFLNLIQAKVRSWITNVSVSGSAKLGMLGGDLMMCYDCRYFLEAPSCWHRCRSCSRVFCRKCMQGSGGAPDRIGQPKFCKFCFQAVGQEEMAVEYDEKINLSISPRRFLDDKLAHLVEVQQCSPLSLQYSTSRCDEDDDEDIDKHFWSPCSVFSQDISDVDTGPEFYSFKSLTSSPFDSPSRADAQGERSPTSQKSGLLDQESLGFLRTPRRESGDLVEHTFDYTDDNLSIYGGCETQEPQKFLDFENNDLIWSPPPPEDEGDDEESGFLTYDDEDDDVGDSGIVFSSSILGSDAFPIKEKPNNANKELLRASVHGHFRALVSQLLNGEGIHVGNEKNGGEGWLDIVSSLACKAANFVKPDTSKGGSMDPGDYVKVKCILSGTPSDSTLIKGVVCTKNVKHKRMISQHRNPRLLILGGAEFQRVPNKFASIETVLQQEIEHLKMAVAKIEAHRPNVLLVEKTVSSYAQEYLLAKEISLVLNVKRPLLERISRCTGAQIASSIDNLASTKLGHCEFFRVERVSEECSSGNQSNKRSNRTLMFFEGCPRRLGCTVLLRGTCQEELKKVKHVVQYASFAAYHLSLETSFLADEGATLPQMPPKSLPDIPGESVNADDSISMPSNSGISSMYQENAVEYQGFSLSNMVGGACFLQCSDVSSLNDKVLRINSEQEEWESSHDYINPCPTSALLGNSEIRGSCSVSSAPDLALHKALNRTPGLQYVELGHPLDHPNYVQTGEAQLLETAIGSGKERILRNSKWMRAVHKPKRTDMVDGNEVPASGDFLSTPENHQSILVSLSRSCVQKGTVCQPSRPLRIQFYGNFDMPLGRYLRDDLFDKTSYCQFCNEISEAHSRCYTHQQGILTISVRRLSSKKLPGEHDGRIWMWHRCLKCAHKDGVPPAARRVIMSDAAWGLSFGKFLELSFSNHSTANRVASCGHSLQRDCLRFYGFGNMVAFFRYSPVDIFSVQLPSLVLKFSSQSRQEWFRREAAEVFSKMEILYAEVFDVLCSMEQNITNSTYEHLKANLHDHVTELKDLLKRERDEYDVFMQPSTLGDTHIGQAAFDIFELNHLRRCLLIDSYIWDRRIYLLDTFVKSSNSEAESRLLEISTHVSLKERSESFYKTGKLGCLLKGTSTRSCKCNSNELASMDLSIKPDESNVGPADMSLVSSENQMRDIHMGFDAAIETSSLENLPSPGSSLSDKIDLAWIGTSHSVKVALSRSLEGGSCRKIMSPVRVYSFDSAVRMRDRYHKARSTASLLLSSVKSSDASGDSRSFLRDQIPNIRRAYSQNSPRATHNLNFLFGHTPFISATSHIVSEGARLLLPQTGCDNIVVAVYDKEPTSLISYALNSREHADFIARKLDQQEGWIENDQIKDGANNPLGYHISCPTASPFELDEIQSRHCGSEEALPSQGGLSLDPKHSHFRVSFDDDISIPTDKAKFSVTCYFAKQFDALRKKCCPNEVEFICSLSRCRRWNAQGGKSNVYFAKSSDERFIIKQVTKTELDSFEDFASEYFKNLMRSINSRSPTCLAKILGIYQVTVKHLKGGREVRMDLMVMENLFFNRSISSVYDLKGSSRSRYNPDTGGRNKVLLDLNLLETLCTKPIFLGSKAKRSLERAIWNDTNFLASIDVMDYSLLVGIDEERKELVLGIIDFVRQYTWDKHLETWVKASGILGGPKNASPTVISPKEYKTRFRKAMSTYFLTVP